MMSKNPEAHVIDVLFEDNGPSGETTGFTGGKTKPGHLWRYLFSVVLAPFVFLSIPTHLLFMKSGHRGATSTIPWIKSIFYPLHPGPIILTTFTLITTLIGTASVLYWTFVIFYSVVILGEVNFDIVDAIYNLIQTLPLYIPTMCIWLNGYSLKATLLGFDTTQFELEKLIESCCSEKMSPRYYSSKSLLGRMFGVYFLIGTIIILKMVLDYTRVRFPTTTPFYKEYDYWHGLWVLMSYNCVLATYCMICWGLQCQLQLFAHYLNFLLIDGRKPTFKILADVKFYFKKCAEQISLVNSTFSLMVSAVVLILLCFVIIDILFIIFYAIPSSVTIAITVLEKYLKHFGIELDIVSPWERYSHTLNQDSSDDNSTTVDQDLLEIYGPVFIRKTVGYIYLVWAQVGLIFFVGLQAINVNTMIRYFSVQFNDYMSSNAGNVSQDLYNEFRVVRIYIVSALNFPGKWIMLRLPVMKYVPIIKDKIHYTGAT